ncbi:MAG: serine acetyltransferase [Muribaculaceae bacterium]|nr:serine acetyltransferase [Muribaculaceae bacterium]
MEGIDNYGANSMQAALDGLSEPPCAMPRRHHAPLLSQDEVREIVDLCRSILFPGFFGPADVNHENLYFRIGVALDELREKLERQVTAALCYLVDNVTAGELSALRHKSSMIADSFIGSLTAIRGTLMTDVAAIYAGDPAADSEAEIIICYPGVKAIANYRIAHRLLELGVPVIPRLISEQAHSETGIDIHPAATIGHSFMIDHGTGIVVGATAIIGHHCRLYQGVTLGARSFAKDESGNIIKGEPRHPILGDNVTVYSNSTLLGRITVGDDAVIGGNLWVTRDVAPGERLVQQSAANNHR